jgi:hypothetical protein
MLTALFQDHAIPARGKLQFGVFVALSHISVIAQNFKFPVPHTGPGGTLHMGPGGGSICSREQCTGPRTTRRNLRFCLGR